MDWDFPTPFTQSLQVQAADIDRLGHTNNACYVIWCEDCAWKHSESLGLDAGDYQNLNRGMAIQKAEYEYFQPSFAGDELQIGTWLTACDGKLRLERRFQILDNASQKTLMRGRWILVCINLETGKPTRFPERFLSIYGAAAQAAM